MIAVRHVTDFGTPQIVEPDGENYVGIAFSRSDVAWEFDPELKWYRHPWNARLRVGDHRWQPGDRRHDPDQVGGNAGYRCQSFVEDKFRFRVGVQPEPEARWDRGLRGPKPRLHGLGQRAFGHRSLCSRYINSSGTGGSVCLIIQDAYGNPATLGEPLPLRVLLDDTRWLRDVIATESLMEIEDLELPWDGKWHRVTIATPDGRGEASQSFRSAAGAGLPPFLRGPAQSVGPL